MLRPEHPAERPRGRRPQAPLDLAHLDARLQALEDAQYANNQKLIEILTHLHHYAADMKEQAAFRSRMYWLGISGIGLLVLNTLGFTVSGIG